MSSRQMLLLVLLVQLFRPSHGEENFSDPNIIGDIKNLLIREGHNLANANLTKNKTSLALIPNDKLIGQLISLFNCGSFPISPNSHLRYSLDYNTTNLRLFQKCNRYFRTTKKPESLLVECRENKWIFNRINCEPTTCIRLVAPPGGHFSTDDNLYNTTVYFWCSPGFYITGTDELFCEENGHWNLPLPSCSISYCPPLPSPIHGFVSTLNATDTNQTVLFECESGYSLLGDVVLRCQDDGRWNNTAPVCTKMCTVSDVSNQTEGVRSIPEFKYLSEGSLLQQGQRVVFSCKPGFSASQSGSSICIKGKFRPPIRCKKSCAATAILNGKYILSENPLSVEYLCLPGYQLVGQRKLSCTSKLIWDSEPPICTKMCTIPKLDHVLSFRRKATYETIPSGTQIVNGTEVHSVCRTTEFPSGKSMTKCLNGTLTPPPCRVRIVENMLEIYYEGKWREICNDSGDVCSLFGSRMISPQKRRCSDRCHYFDRSAFLETAKIVMQDYRYGEYCLACSGSK